MLVCPVRECHLALAHLADRRLACPRGHSFDIARSGYVNLLQPQDRRSRQPGDSVAAVAARARLHDRGITELLLRAISELLPAQKQEVVLDAGCGVGYYLGQLALEKGLAGHGVDISLRAVDAAARRYPFCQWVVANADRFLPYEDQSFSTVLSITARMNATEFRRVLREGGRLLVAVPSPDDLAELRGPGRNRVPRTLQTFSEGFTLLAQRRAITSADLDASAVEDVLLSIYRPLQAEPAGAMRLTFALDLLLFEAR